MTMRDKRKILTAYEASELLRSTGLPITPNTLRLGIEEYVFPFGWCITDEHNHVCQCYVSRKRLLEWMDENGLGDNDGNTESKR